MNTDAPATRHHDAHSAHAGAMKAFAFGALATGAFAVGALATGAFFTGLRAIGTLAVGRFLVRGGKIRRLEIDDLVVRRLRVLEGDRAP